MFNDRLRALFLLAIMFSAVGATPRVEPTIPQRWKVAIDSRYRGDWLSVRRGIVYSVRDAHVVALDLETGRLRWTSAAKVEGRPAVGGRTIFAPIVNGMVAIDARTGREFGRVRFAQTPTLITTDFAAVAIANTDTGTRMLGFRDTLQPRWHRELARQWGSPDDVGHEVLLIWDASNSSVIALDARNGNAIATTDGVEEYVGRDSRTLWFSVAGGGLKSLDLDTNGSVAIHNHVVRGAVRVEGRTAVAVLDGRLTSISLPDGVETPLHVDGRWVGGPADGTIFVSRQDGTYTQRLAGGKPVRLVTNTSDERFLTSTGKNAYFATNGGAIVVANLDDDATTGRLASTCRFVEGIRIVDGAALVHCDDDHMSSHLYGFSLPAQIH